MAHEVQGASDAGRPVPDPVASVVQGILSAIPAGCTWLLPVLDDAGQIVDFRIGAAGDHGRDIYGRGSGRVGALLSELYPSMVDGRLWRMYRDVVTTGTSDHLSDFRYEEKQAGVVADSQFDVIVHPALGGLLVSWQRIDESQRRLDRTELLGRLGWAEYDLATGLSEWSPGMYRIFERDPASGPMSRAEQAAALLPDDRGISETAWQTLDSGAASEVTVRFEFGGAVKYLRVHSDVARDADGAPLKIYAVLQDITARESSRTEIERLRDQLRTREMTALAEHRLAAQLQSMIQPVPREPFALAGLAAMVNYLPAESASQVGGDWYHAQTLPDGQVALAIGDVAGHGMEAASGMAHLRYALIAWLSSGIRDPGILLANLNQLCGQLEITGTAVVALYEPASRTMRWARAGHMPPLLARGGRADSLDRPPGMLLGAVRETTYPVRSPRLAADDLVLFYTDGLVERRSAGIDELLGRVKDTLAEVSTDPAGQQLSRLRSLLQQASPDDDTCTVAVRVMP
jgi:serine phosphatase RsbU (regulator of sigma subunit)